MILDTTAIIDLLRGNQAIIKKISELQDRNVPLSLTSISVFEIWQGTAGINDKGKLNKIHFLLDSLGTFLLDIPAAKEAGFIHALLKEQGMTIDPEDSMIAGIASYNKESVLTRNTKHFQRIDNLAVESY